MTKRKFTDRYVGTKGGFDFFVSESSHAPAKKITMDDVWGKYVGVKLISNGMIVARSDEICPIWKDKLPYKSVTVVCKKKDEDEVIYWLEYVHGADCVSRRKELPKGKVALRSNYMCW